MTISPAPDDREVSDLLSASPSLLPFEAEHLTESMTFADSILRSLTVSSDDTEEADEENIDFDDVEEAMTDDEGDEDAFADKDFEEFDVPVSKTKSGAAGKSKDGDDYDVDEEFKDLFTDSGSFDDEEDDF